MGVRLVTKNNFKIILKNKDNHQIDVDYELHHSALSEKWANKIKHLKRVPIDPIESGIDNVSDIQQLYKQFCEFAGLEPIQFDTFNQSTYNTLHKIYEQQHEKLIKKKDYHTILYKFHHSIHYNEQPAEKNGRAWNHRHGVMLHHRPEAIQIGWGIKEGPLTEQFDCHSYYADQLEQNNIYQPWAELGKKPFKYWSNKEPNDQKRINELCKPHKTLRAKFFISLKDITPKKFPPDFIQWFNQYKKDWILEHKIKDYTEIHQYSAPLLAHTSNKQDLTGYKFVRIES
jgi:hypothetical protein